MQVHTFIVIILQLMFRIG